MGDPGHIESDASEVASMEGARVELIRHSTGCDSEESQGLIEEVGPWVEYPAEAVRTLKANCSFAVNPGVEVHVENSAVLFDFSNVEAPGRFPDGEFEGYILKMLRTAEAPVIVAALVDRNTTTLGLIQDDLMSDQDRLLVNLAGLSYDSSDFIRLDLYLMEVSDQGQATSSDQL
jgi:hypothetical protein